jgi:class 3 adenylate cyclase
LRGRRSASSQQPGLGLIERLTHAFEGDVDFILGDHSGQAERDRLAHVAADGAIVLREAVCAQSADRAHVHRFQPREFRGRDTLCGVMIA